MFLGDPLDYESPSKKKRALKQRALKQRKIDARNQQVADLDANRKTRQQAVRDKYPSPTLRDTAVPDIAPQPKDTTAQFDGPFGVVRPRAKVEIVSDPVAKRKLNSSPSLAKPKREEDINGLQIVRPRSKQGSAGNEDRLKVNVQLFGKDVEKTLDKPVLDLLQKSLSVPNTTEDKRSHLGSLRKLVRDGKITRNQKAALQNAMRLGGDSNIGKKGSSANKMLNYVVERLTVEQESFDKKFDKVALAASGAGIGVGAMAASRLGKTAKVANVKELQISGGNAIPKGENLLRRQTKDVGGLAERTALGVKNPELPTKITYDRITGNDAKRLGPSVNKFLIRKDNKFRSAVRQIGDGEIRHALRKHGHDPIPLKSKDLANIPDVVKNGEVVGVQRNRDNTGITYRKKINGNWLYVVEKIAGESNITLRFITAYWTRGAEK
jgi:hypothetical protein